MKIPFKDILVPDEQQRQLEIDNLMVEAGELTKQAANIAKSYDSAE